MSSDPTLTYIKEKVDEMAHAIVQLARMEERMLTLFKRMEKHDESIDSIDERVKKIEVKVGINGQISKFLERAFLIILSGGIGYIYSKLK